MRGAQSSSRETRLAKPMREWISSQSTLAIQLRLNSFEFIFYFCQIVNNEKAALSRPNNLEFNKSNNVTPADMC